MSDLQPMILIYSLETKNVLYSVDPPYPPEHYAFYENLPNTDSTIGFATSPYTSFFNKYVDDSGPTPSLVVRPEMPIVQTYGESPSPLDPESTVTTLTITGIPVGSTLSVPELGEWELGSDTTAELVFSTPGTYHITISNFPYLPWSDSLVI